MPAASREWNAAQRRWAREQDALDIPMIEQTVKALTPSGRAVQANRFDFATPPASASPTCAGSPAAS